MSLCSFVVRCSAAGSRKDCCLSPMFAVGNSLAVYEDRCNGIEDEPDTDYGEPYGRICFEFIAGVILARWHNK